MDELNPSVTGVIAQAISQPPLRSMYAADDDDTPKSKIRNSSWKKNDDDDVFDL